VSVFNINLKTGENFIEIVRNSLNWIAADYVWMEGF